MLTFFTFSLMAIVAYASLAEGLFMAGVMLVNVVVAGLIAFNFWEPLAARLEPLFRGTLAVGYEDTFCLVFLFWITLGVLRLLADWLVRAEIRFPRMIQRAGGGLFGLGTGYLLAGFLVCVLQTMPLHEHFLSFEPRYEPGATWRRYFPPDRVWLAFMQRAGASALAQPTEPFDKDGSFALRYARYRRYNDSRDPSDDGRVPYNGEYDREPGAAAKRP